MEVKNWLKKHFIPHAENDHRPHFLHGKNTRNIIAGILILEIFAFLLPTLTNINKIGNMAAVLPAVLSSLTNEERQAQNLPTLTINPLLVKAAEMKAEDMATNGYFAHTSPEGKSPWYWLIQAGYKYQYAGENLAINFTDSQDVTKAWMNSPTHRANIVKDKYTEVGTAIATGTYKGRETTFVAQFYANPLVIKPVETTSTEVNTENLVVNDNTSKTEEPSKVLGAEVVEQNGEVMNDNVTPVEKPTVLQKAFASPRNTTNIILYIVWGIVSVVLLVYIFLRKRNHHRDLITNGLIILVIIGAIFVANYFLTNRNALIIQSFHFSSETK